MMKSRLGDLQLYKFDAPFLSNIGVILVSQQGVQWGCVISLTACTGQRQRDSSKAGLSKEFEDLLSHSFFNDKKDSKITNQIFDYLVSNFSFKDLTVVPPACPVLVFHFHIRESYHGPAPQVHINSAVMSLLNITECSFDVENAGPRFVPIAPTTTKIIDCYRGQELCAICDKGYPKEGEIVYKTVCNHIFHGNCISSQLLVTPKCPVCSKDLTPVDIRTLLF